ncbi:MAG: hypothetical protein M3Y72_14685 [Acidobacteriota bacterium]|nr:hypothetical protein [Acidobacteriota bacterium]
MVLGGGPQTHCKAAQAAIPRRQTKEGASADLGAGRESVVRRISSKEKLLPNGESSIIFTLRDEPIRIYDAQDLTRYDSYGQAVLSGARSNCFVIDSHQKECVVGVQFRPGGAFPFFTYLLPRRRAPLSISNVYGPGEPVKYASGFSLRAVSNRCSPI